MVESHWEPSKRVPSKVLTKREREVYQHSSAQWHWLCKHCLNSKSFSFTIFLLLLYYVKKKACEHTRDIKNSNFFASAQCLGYDNQKGDLTMEMCFPTDKTIMKQVMKMKRLFIRISKISIFELLILRLVTHWKKPELNMLMSLLIMITCLANSKRDLKQ